MVPVYGAQSFHPKSEFVVRTPEKTMEHVFIRATSFKQEVYPFGTYCGSDSHGANGEGVRGHFVLAAYISYI
jgi:hypothetical protein